MFWAPLACGVSLPGRSGLLGVRGLVCFLLLHHDHLRYCSFLIREMIAERELMNAMPG